MAEITLIIANQLNFYLSNANLIGPVSNLIQLINFSEKNGIILV